MDNLIAQYFPDFACAGIAAGIKDNGKHDLGLLYLNDCQAAAAVFTQHTLPAPSVLISKQHINTCIPKAVIVNSGCANACLGDLGMADAQHMIATVAAHLGIEKESVLIAQTGMIGSRLDRKTVDAGLAEICAAVHNKAQDWTGFARSILTTDLSEKLSAQKFGKTGIVMGVTKGAGMIAPNMATTLSFLVTNMQIQSDLLQQCLQKAINNTYNKCSVDTDTSTNDMVVILSSGTEKADRADFEAALTACCYDLMSQLLKDAEGAKKMIVARVYSAASERAANKMARSVVDSPLVKSMVAGEMLNWGRLLMAIGKVDEPLNLENISLYIQDVCILEKGQEIAASTADFSADTLYIDIHVGMGEASGVAYGCDMHEAYATINKDKS